MVQMLCVYIGIRVDVGFQFSVTARRRFYPFVLGTAAVCRAGAAARAVRVTRFSFGASAAPGGRGPGRAGCAGDARRGTGGRAEGPGSRAGESLPVLRCAYRDRGSRAFRAAVSPSNESPRSNDAARATPTRRESSNRIVAGAWRVRSWRRSWLRGLRGRRTALCGCEKGHSTSIKHLYTLLHELLGFVLPPYSFAIANGVCGLQWRWQAGTASRAPRCLVVSQPATGRG